MYSANLAIAAAVSVGVLSMAYMAGFFPVYVAIGCIAVFVYLAFANGGPKKRVNSRPKYLYDD